MSYKSTLQEHNTLLQQAIDKANALPDAENSVITEDLSSELEAQAQLIALQTSKINELITELDGKASGDSNAIETCTLRLVGTKIEGLGGQLPENNAHFDYVIYQTATINNEGVFQTSWDYWNSYDAPSNELVEIENVIINCPITLFFECENGCGSMEGVNVDILYDDWGMSGCTLIQCTNANDVCTFTVANEGM